MNYSRCLHLTVEIGRNSPQLRLIRRTLEELHGSLRTDTEKKTGDKWQIPNDVEPLTRLVYKGKRQFSTQNNFSASPDYNRSSEIEQITSTWELCYI